MASGQKQLILRGQALLRQCQAFSRAVSELARGTFVPIAEDELLSPLADRPGDPLAQFLEDLVDIQRTIEIDFNDATGIPGLRLCFVGPDAYQEGLTCGQLMVKELGNQGKIAIILGSTSHVGYDLRRRGFTSAVFDRKNHCEIVDLIETQGKPDLTRTLIDEVLDREPELRGLYACGGSILVHVLEAIRDHPRAAEIVLIGHDLLPASAAGIASGLVRATLSQDPFVQGHNPLIHLYNHLRTGWTPESGVLPPAMDLIDRSNLDEFWDAANQTTRRDRALDRLAQPMTGGLNRPLRLAVIGKTGSFWDEPQAGAQAASATLAALNCAVDWVIPEAEDQAKPIAGSAYLACLQRLGQAGYDGLSVIASEKESTAIINDLMRQGLSVVTWNTEPSGLSNLLFMIRRQIMLVADHARHLVTNIASGKIAVDATQGIVKTVQEGSVSLNQSVGALQARVTNLDDFVASIRDQAQNSAAVSTESAAAIQASALEMQDTIRSMEAIQGAVESSWTSLEDLSTNSAKIDTILEAITNVAAKIRLLSINASVEAARAGEHGRGFAVIAKEVRSLSEQAQAASDAITTIVKDIHGGIGSTREELAAGLRQVRDSASRTASSRRSLETIRQGAETNQQRQGEIIEFLDRIRQASTALQAEIDQVAKVSQTGQGSASQLSTASEVLSDQLSAIETSALALAHLAEHERDILLKFHLGND